MPNVAAVVVAAGRGTRAANNLSRHDLPKQFRQIGGQTVLSRTLSMLVEHGNVGAVQPVIHAEHIDLYRAAVTGISGSALLAPAFGGATRQASVRAGLEALSTRKP